MKKQPKYIIEINGKPTYGYNSLKAAKTCFAKAIYFYNLDENVINLWADGEIIESSLAYV